jgi:hypothetical protein
MKVVVLMLLLAGCGKKASDEIDFGTVENSVYHNNYFGLNVPLPKEWSVQDQTEQRRLMKLGGKIISGNDKSMEAVLKASELQSVNLFGVFEHPPDSPVTFNPSILAIAEDVRHLPGIKTGKDYHFQSRKVLESGQLDISFPKEIYTQQIGGVGFDVMEAEMHVRTMIVKQKYYSAIMKGYALSVVVSFVTDEQDAALLKILEGVTFNQSAAP